MEDPVYDQRGLLDCHVGFLVIVSATLYSKEAQ